MLITGRHLNKINNKRAGVIPYTIHNTKLYYLLGVDRKFNEYTDFGGGCKTEETLLEGAWREFNEESCNIFCEEVNLESLASSISVINNEKDEAVFFVYIDYQWLYSAEDAFLNAQHKLISYSNNENSSVKWFESNEFNCIMFNKKIKGVWKRLQNFISNNCTNSQLESLLVTCGDIEQQIRLKKLQIN